MTSHAYQISLLFVVLAAAAHGAEDKPVPDYQRDVAPIFQKFCVSCHSTDQAKSDLDLSSHSALMEGGKRGASVIPGKSVESRLVLSLEGKAKPAMPPKGKPAPSDAEVALLKRWIDAGARAPSKTIALEPVIPVIKPTVESRPNISAVAVAPDGKLAAVASYKTVVLFDPTSGAVLRRIDNLPGQVTSVKFSTDGGLLAIAAGEPGRFGEARLYRAADAALVRAVRGHADSLYAAELSRDGKLLATAGYDKLIQITDAATGKLLKTLKGHNDAVFALAFRPDGKLLASASGDRTVKLWNIAAGARLDTFSQATKEQYGVIFSPQGDRVAAVGADNRIRVWNISEAAAEGSNPIQVARFAHQTPIIKIICSADGKLLATSAEDRTVKLWDFATVAERLLLEPQPDWAPALAFSADAKTLLVGRHDGSLSLYDTSSGKRIRDYNVFESTIAARIDQRLDQVASKVVAPSATKSATKSDKALKPEAKTKPAPAPPPAPPKPLPKPELTAVWPMGLQAGKPARIKVTGKNLLHASRVESNDGRITGKVIADPKPTDTELWIELSAAKDLPRGAFEVGLATTGGSGNRLKIHVDDIPQLVEAEPNDSPGNSFVVPPLGGPGSENPPKGGTTNLTPKTASAPGLPVAYWGRLAMPGDIDFFTFDAKKGQTIVFDLSANSIGSALNGVVTVFDSAGRVVASGNDFDRQVDPLVAFAIPTDDRYSVRVTDLKFEGSANHYYRLSIGAFAYVTGVYPLGLPANVERPVDLVGYNLPVGAKATIKTPAMGEAPLPLDASRFRSRQPLKLAVGALPEVVEAEPNDTPDRATPMSAPGVANGRLWPAVPGRLDVDLFKFRSKKGETWIIESAAEQLGSPVDTRIEVLDAAGRPIERVLLQAVRDSVIEFRGITSSALDVRCSNWLEMELNELMYLDGEVCRLFRMPQGPDSGFVLYAANGRRRTYFDTSSTAHAANDACYIVQPHPPGTRLIPNGLPVFSLFYANDDSADRKIGKDSRLTIATSYDGEFVVRVVDNRALGGDRYAYRLTLRKPRPDFSVALGGVNPTINAGSGKEIGVSVDRIDGFEGAIKIDLAGLPPGFSVSPMGIEAGHADAQAVLRAAANAPALTDKTASQTKATATAVIDGKTVTKPVNNLGKITLAAKPKLMVSIEPAEVTIAPGSTVVCTLKIERNGVDGPISFQPKNLPHGVIVDNIGLNGILIPAGQNQRQLFLAARRWVPSASRPWFLVAQSEGNQASDPVILHVRPPKQLAGARR